MPFSEQLPRLEVGTLLDGFCNGYFGRDSYGDKLVIASGTWNGDYWIVAREGNEIVTATGVPKGLLEDWMN